MLPALLRESFPESAIRSGYPLFKAWPTLLVVDHDQEMVRVLVCFFEKRGFHVAAAENINEAKMVFQRRKFWTLVLCDYHLPDGLGWDLAAWVHEQSEKTPVLLMSGSPYCSTLCAGIDYLAKPFPPEKLEQYVRALPLRD